MIVHQNVHKKIKPKRTVERQLLFSVSLVIVIMLVNLLTNQQREFDSATQGYKDGTVMNLQKGFNENTLAGILKNGNYLEDDRDIAFVNQELSLRLNNRGNLENLGALNKDGMSIRASYADSMGGREIRRRVRASLSALNFDNEMATLYRSRTLPPSHIDSALGSPSIIVSVMDSDEKAEAGVIVILEQHFLSEKEFDGDGLIYDSTRFPEGGLKVKVFSKDRSRQQELSYTRYATTDKDGKAVFSGLKKGGSYSVLPVKKGFEYGPSKGAVSLDQDLKPVFTQKIQTIKLFSAATYAQLKEDDVLTIRTPEEYRQQLFLWFAAFLLAWWLVHLYWSVKGGSEDQLLLPVLMLLCGICLIVMYAIHDPLSDSNRGNEMAGGAIIGLFGLSIVSSINFVQFYNSKWFDYLGNKFGKRLYNQPGYVYLAMAFGLSVILLRFGKGPEGSGVKVNLNIGFLFQPSEITKYLVVVFFAAYFSRKSGFLQNIPNLWLRIKNLLPIFLLLTSLLGIYLYLGDMGPALVLCGTFIIFYSVARGDFAQLALGALSYVALMLVASKGLHGGKMLLLAFTGAWLLAWIAYGLIAKKTIYETAIFLVFVISAFIFGEDLPNVGQRLKDRNDMFKDVWNNETYGGDQVAHGIWSITSGGITGQGLGEGGSKVMPANHTDMVLASIGEELGFIGLVVVMCCMAILLHRSLLIARKAGHPFAFYLAAGILVVTGIQFFIITAGCLGLMPLTGITVPFLSYGRVSMIINIAAMGVVFSVSRLNGNAQQNKYIRDTYDNTIFFGSLSYTLATLGILGVLFYYQWIATDRFIAKPALVVNKMGERIASYNPRIQLLMKRLEAGNIYDRNKLLLATGNKEMMLAQKERITTAGVPDSIIDKQSVLKLRRYYPFGAHMFFWLGDYNNRLLWGKNVLKGYFAEHKHLTALRGFDSSPDNEPEMEVPASRYREDRFLPPHPASFNINNYDYSELVPLLKAGFKSDTVKAFNLVKRDITLTVDAALQTRLQNEMIRHTNEEPLRAKWRSAVVVVNAGTGEVLASAMNPLPDIATLKELNELRKDEQRKAIDNIKLNNKVFTETDLGTTFPTAPGSTAKVISGLAGLNKLGVEKVAKLKYYVYEDEKFRTHGFEQDPIGYIDMDSAIVHSSNVYFIKLINEQVLDDELSKLYQALGIGIGTKGRYFFYNNQTPFDQEKNREYWRTKIYNNQRSLYYNKKLPRRERLISDFSYLAWGQGQMTATPLAMARLTGAVANGGVMRSSKFILESSAPLRIPNDSAIRITGDKEAKLMEDFMKQQSARFSAESQVKVAGKTGTPHRKVPGIRRNFDGWYMFSTYSAKLSNPIVVCIRIERAESSAVAKKLAAEVVVPVLKNLDYIK